MIRHALLYEDAPTTSLTPEIIFRLLADETRLRCMTLLCAHHELSLLRFTHTLQLRPTVVMRQLATLRAARLVSERSTGSTTSYRLHPALPVWTIHMLRAVSNSIVCLTPYISDQAILVSDYQAHA